MARATYVLRNGELVEKHLATPLPGHRGPFVVSDGMDPTECPADGKTYDSRSAYYRAVREAGCAIVEPGIYQPRRSAHPTVGQSMRQAFQRLSSR